MKTTYEDDEVRIIGGANWKRCREEESEGVSRKVTRLVAPRRRWSVKCWCLVLLLILSVFASLAYWGYDAFRYRLDFPISRTQRTVLQALERNDHPVAEAGVTLTVDTILGVQMKLYHISGLQATLVTQVPSLSDTDVYLVTRCADYRYDQDKKKMIGDYIVDGHMMSQSSWRAGYFVSYNGNVEIGVGRRPLLRRYMTEHGGSMFRQFALVSSGVKCVSQYLLKGKVSRCAYARTPDGDLYFVETVNRETLYGFSEALAEYGFVDAIYITGGSQPQLFYRHPNGIATGNYIDDKSHAIIVWTKKDGADSVSRGS